MKRYFEIDVLRGIAILMMVIFHLFWNLKFFGLYNFSLTSGLWLVFQRIIVFLFVGLVGTGLYLSFHRKKEYYVNRFFLRGLKTFFLGMLISIVTFVLFPKQYVFFGILHLIGISIMLSILFVKYPKISGIVSIPLLLAPYVFDLYLFNIQILSWIGLSNPPATLDYVPIIPWFGVVLISIFFTSLFYRNGIAKFDFKNPNLKVTSFLQFIGKKSLLIYLIHQPILFPLIYFISEYLI